MDTLTRLGCASKCPDPIWAASPRQGNHVAKLYARPADGEGNEGYCYNDIFKKKKKKSWNQLQIKAIFFLLLIRWQPAMCVSETERRWEQGSKHTLELTRFLGIIRSAHLYLRNAKSRRGIKHGCILPNSWRWLASALPGSWQILLAVFPPVKHSPMPSVLAFALHARSHASGL